MRRKAPTDEDLEVINIWRAAHRPVLNTFQAILRNRTRINAPMFARRSGQAWKKDAWKHPIRAAVSNARLPSGVTAYTLRHSVITDLIRNGLPVRRASPCSAVNGDPMEAVKPPESLVEGQM